MTRWEEEFRSATTNATYIYDVVNRLTKITDSGNLAVTFAYDAVSKLTSKTLPNGVAATYTYDGLDRLTRLKDAKGNTVIADNQYSYNTAGDITQNIDQSGTHVYGYDTIDRLTSATYTGTPNETYAYDSVGNRTSSHKSPTYGYQPFNRLVSTSTATYIYNNNGNMVSKTEGTGTTQYVWDFENRLTQVATPSSGSVTYKYDALGRRIQRTPSSGVSTNFIYDGQDVVKDINSDGTTVEYLNGPGIDNKIRQKGSSTSTTYYFSQDHLGSTTALTGTTGKLVERQTYDAYGNSGGSTRTRYGYTGRERDPLTGLLYYRARFYDPQVGRFLSEDPMGLSVGPNPYEYAYDNPLRYVDPTGNQPWQQAALAGGGTLGGLAGSGALGAAAAAALPPVAVAAAGAALIYGAWHLGEWIAERPWNPLTRPVPFPGHPGPISVPKCDNPPKATPLPPPPPDGEQTCRRLLKLCLSNPWQPGWNRGFGPRKDCGACYRQCKNDGGAWPFEKCPIFHN